MFFSRTSQPISVKLGTNYFWVKGIQIVQIKSQVQFKEEIITKIQKWDEVTLKSSQKPLRKKISYLQESFMI